MAMKSAEFIQKRLEVAIRACVSPTGRRGKIGLALSGGMDSVLLAEFLHRMGISFVALHFNHRWRGKKSEQDTQWVRQWCRARKIPLKIARAKQKGFVSEDQARRERFDFFQKAAQQSKLSQIWLAHHADDLVETFLLQLLRGAGPEGLVSLKKERKIGKLRIVRPWLDFFKEELQRQAKIWKLKWREDHSNRDTAYFRNRIRCQLLPYLAKLSKRDVRRQLHRTAVLLGDENAYWETFFPARWPVRASVAELRGYPVALQRRWIRGWLLSRKIKDISFDDIESVRQLLVQQKPARVNLSQNKSCRRRSGWLSIF